MSKKRIRLSGDTVKNATVSYDPMTGSPGISLEFDDLGKKVLDELPINIVLKLMELLED